MQAPSTLTPRRRAPRRALISLVTLLATAALSSCAQTGAPPAPVPTSTTASPTAASEPESQRLARELKAMIGPASCSSDAQCRTVPVGAKACGGPQSYWAWSTVGTDEARLRALAQRQADAHRREVEASGLRSNCAVVTDPGARCVAGSCQVNAPGNRALP